MFDFYKISIIAGYFKSNLTHKSRRQFLVHFVAKAKESLGPKEEDYGLISIHCFYKNIELEIQKNF